MPRRPRHRRRRAPFRRARDELKKGNVAVAIFIAALFVSIAIVVGSGLR